MDPNAKTHLDFPHLSSEEWAAVERMVDSIGPVAVNSVLTALTVEQQHAAIFTFVHREAVEGRHHVAEVRQHLADVKSQQGSTPVAQPRVDHLKIDVAKYRGSEGESLLRWLVELEAALLARGIANDAMQVTFAMSNLAGRAKTWAYGRRLADHTCFPTYEVFRQELKQAFEPPKTEFRARAEFLALKQGKRDIHTYSQHARYLISCIVNEPVDNQTQVVTYMTGLADGPIKTYLFREYPATMEDAIFMASQEAFSLNQAHVHSAQYRPPKSKGGEFADTAEPMDLSAIETSKSQGNGKRDRICNRCKKKGHFAYECLAKKPASRSGSTYKSNRKFGDKKSPSNSSKNDESQ
jgi:hypothetical protein